MSDCWSTNVVASDDEGPVPPGGGPLPPAGNNQLPLPLPFGAVGNEQDPQRLRPSNRYEVDQIVHYNSIYNCRSGSIGGQANEDRSDTWSLDAIASDSEADGGRERERQVEETSGSKYENEREFAGARNTGRRASTGGNRGRRAIGESTRATESRDCGTGHRAATHRHLAVCRQREETQTQQWKQSLQQE